MASARGKDKYAHLIGQTFGKLRVTEVLPPDASGSIELACVCTCGVVRKVVAYRLVSQQITSCNKGTCHCNFRDITGQKFNKLEAVGVSHFKDGCAFWHFKCDCGNKLITRSVSVTQGRTQSCGCLVGIRTRHERAKKFGPQRGVVRHAYRNYVRDAAAQGITLHMTLAEYESMAKLPCRYCGTTDIRRERLDDTDVAINGVVRLDASVFEFDIKNAVPCCFICRRVRGQGVDAAVLQHARAIIAHQNMGAA